MILGIMSDSHDNLEALLKALEIFRKYGVEVIIHLGDIISPFTFMRLLEYPGRIIVVLGNNDGDAVLLKELAVKAGAILKKDAYATEIGGRRIFLMHGFADPELTKTVAHALGASGKFDIILYGHTHKSEAIQIGKTIVLNPGEVCGYITGKRSIAILNTVSLEYKVTEF
ncbi:MAG: metallophosphoesterase [Ignisphaera sp.]|jgi:putative phosphoesterase|nr:metallophosphoesterase [Ignisphaera sp.]MCC6055560.1 metallophosphoesterase [Desulfurococcaceae archaeon]